MDKPQGRTTGAENPGAPSPESLELHVQHVLDDSLPAERVLEAQRPTLAAQPPSTLYVP